MMMRLSRSLISPCSTLPFSCSGMVMRDFYTSGGSSDCLFLERVMMNDE